MPPTPAPPSQSTLLHRGGPPGTWGNLGLWDTAASYADACRTLAERVGTAAGITAGDRVLGIACGAGDDLRLWVGHFGAGHATGVELDAALATRARTCTESVDPGRFSVLTRSALDLHDLPARDFDRVVCVDAAYHLKPRTAFLAAALRCLRPGGTLAYTDLSLAGQAGMAVRAAARACGLDPDDLATADEQVARLARAGFEATHVEALDDRVLDGFSRFVFRQTGRLGADAWRRGWRKPLATALLIRALHGAGLGYALLAARRPRP